MIDDLESVARDEAAFRALEETHPVENKVIDLMAALKQSLSPAEPERAAEMIVVGVDMATEPDMSITSEPAVVVDAQDPIPLAAQHLESPSDTREWKVVRQDGIETFLSPDNVPYVRARPDEEADVIVSFTRTRGMTPLRLVASEQSSTVRRARRKARREKQELQKRGYDVEE